MGRNHAGTALWAALAIVILCEVSPTGAEAQSSNAPSAADLGNSQRMFQQSQQDAFGRRPANGTLPSNAANSGRAPMPAQRFTPYYSFNTPYFNADLQKAIDAKDYAFLLAYYDKRCQAKDAASFTAMEDYISSGKGVGNCYFLAGLYRDGQGVPADMSKALTLYQTAADGGFWPAVVTLSVLYLDGSETGKDVAKGIGYLTSYTTNPKNSDKGVCTGAATLAHFSIQGKYVPQSGVEAEKWYKYCADKLGSPHGAPSDLYVHNLRMLGDLYNDKTLMPGREADAAAAYARIIDYADGSHYREDAQPAQRGLGQMYIEGRGVAKDVNKGIGLLKAAVNRSVTDPASAVILYKVYSTGEVVPADQTQANSYLDIALQAKSPEAQTIAAQNALKADPPQPDKAKALLLAAVVTGYAPAQYEYGNYYLKYGSAAAGPVTAYLWFDLAAQNGHADAAKARDALTAKLTPTDLQQIKNAEVQLKAKYPDIVGDE
ncbi:MAG TPA: hypothetical protein VG839_06280 [Asticcacaulis sp.]|nr:hypothetical protein [Asticcacaulis sp.]